MNTFPKIVIGLGAWYLAGCAETPHHGTVPSTSRNSDATSSISLPPDRIATINGREINDAAFYDLLMDIDGPRVFEELLNLTVVRVAAANAGINAVRDDTTALGEMMQAEYKLMVNSVPLTKEQEDEIRKDPRIGATTTKPDDAVFNVRKQILDNAWTQQRRTFKEIQMILEQQALLRDLSKVADLDPKPEEIMHAFDNKYGEKVNIVLISLGDVRHNAEEAAIALRKVLNATMPTSKITRADLEKGLGDKSLANYKMQLKPAVIPKNADELNTIRDEAFNAKIPDGGLSALVVFTPPGATSKESYYLIWIEKHQPADTSVKLIGPQVGKELTKAVLFDKQNTWMNQRLAELRQRAEVTVNDPTLSKIFKDWFDRMHGATSQAASGSANLASTGPAPATAPTGPVLQPIPSGPKPATLPAMTPLSPPK